MPGRSFYCLRNRRQSTRATIPSPIKARGDGSGTVDGSWTGAGIIVHHFGKATCRKFLYVNVYKFSHTLRDDMGNPDGVGLLLSDTNFFLLLRVENAKKYQTFCRSICLNCNAVWKQMGVLRKKFEALRSSLKRKNIS
jgi:hypothetical protein